MASDQQTSQQDMTRVKNERVPSNDQVHGEDSNDDNGDLQVIVDKGYAWLVVIGGAASMFFPGFSTCWGTKLTVLGSMIVFLGFMLTGEATQIWHIYLCLGSTSIGMAIMLGVIYRSTPQWFVKKRATAFGIQTSAISLGSLTLPFIIIKIYNDLGYQWIYRIFGIASLGINAIAMIFIKDQPTAKKTGQTEEGSKPKNFDFDVLKKLDMILWIMVGPLSVSGRFIMFTFLPAHARQLGLSSTQIAALNSIGAASQALADRMGYLNMYIISTLVCSGSVFTIWLLANGFAELVVFSITFCFVCGTYTSISNYLIIVIYGAMVASLVDNMNQYPSAINFSMISSVFIIVLPLLATLSGKNSSHITSVTDITGYANDPSFYYKIMTGGFYVYVG
ncbi:major facilitator superfamily domain-containing protein [Phascolomyces articulosus]|uniref:Major facilitator superfamily domain-containing protein n=1 Tax=Phascolomyces articulosus TaxID=60185 RepID=A0AAD5KLB4_9FUNG|nr:major facilitator superfamily domain-containing protein [Phascolomyces articulosus]